MTQSNEKLLGKITFGIVGLILLFISFYLYTNYIRVTFPISIDQQIDFFTKYSNSDFIQNNNFRAFPLEAIAIFFSFSFLALALVDESKFQSVSLYLVILNTVFLFPFFILPTIQLKLFSIFHFSYFIISLLPYFHFRNFSFRFRPGPFLLIFPLLLASIYYTNKSIYTRNSANSGLIQREVYESINPSEALPIPTPKEVRWVYTSGKGYEKVRLKAVLFTGFQCKECKEVNEIIKDIAKKFRGHISLQFLPFPHSAQCNPFFKGKEETLDCQISKLAVCLNTNTFPQVFDILMQPNIEHTSESLLTMAKRAGKQDCFTGAAGDNLLSDLVSLTEVYNINSSPMLLVNGIPFKRPFNVKKIDKYLLELLRRAF